VKQVIIAILLMTGISLFLTTPTFAQEPGSPPSVEAVNLFTWATSNPPNWGQGVLYTVLGLVGALVTLFGLIGGVVPGTAGSARIEAGMKRVEEREKILDELIRSEESDSEKIEAIEIATNNLRDDLSADRQRQFTLAALLYAVLGAFFAALLARDLLQALVIGAGWTAYLGVLGLKKDYSERKSVKDEAIQKLLDALSQRDEAIRKLLEGAPSQMRKDEEPEPDVQKGYVPPQDLNAEESIQEYLRQQVQEGYRHRIRDFEQLELDAKVAKAL